MASKRFLDAYSADKRLDKYSGDIVINSYPYEVFVGSISDWQGSTKRTIVAMETMEGATYEMQHNYAEKAFMSMDGLVRPVSLDGDGGLPPFVRKSGESDDAIQQDDLNPFTNPDGFNRSTVASTRSDTDTFGHDIDLVGRSGTPEYQEAPSGGLIMPIAGFSSSGYADYRDDYRFLALRGPLVMQGWGYDTDGYPVPNKNDVAVDAAQGKFKNSGLDANKFLDGHLKKPQTWPVAPVDLRLDRARGVWVAPTSGASPQEEDNTIGETRIIAITSNYHGSCCSYEGITRIIDWEDSDDICTTSGIYQDVWLHKYCDTLGPNPQTDCWCVIGRKEKTEVFCGESGYPVYDFLTLATDCDGTTPCDCCCPSGGDHMFVHLTYTSGNAGCAFDTTVTLTHTDNLESVTPACGGSNPVFISGAGYYGDFSVTVDYPTILYRVNGTIHTCPDPITGCAGIYLATDYNSWTLDSAYTDINGDLVEITDWSWSSNDGACRFLVQDGEISYQSITIPYRVVYTCKVITGSVVAQVAILNMGLHGSGYIGDEGSWYNTGQCYLNTQRGEIGVDFGNGECLKIVNAQDPYSNSFSYNFNMWSHHYFKMCKCGPSGQIEVDQYWVEPCNSLNNNICDNQMINVQAWW